MRIFVIDDDPALARGTAQLLADEGWDVRSYTQVLAAIEAIKREPPDLLITDLSMPWVDGKDLITIARQTVESLKVIIISGFDRGASIARSVGADFLAKPLDAEELTKRVNDLAATMAGPTPQPR